MRFRTIVHEETVPGGTEPWTFTSVVASQFSHGWLLLSKDQGAHVGDDGGPYAILNAEEQPHGPDWFSAASFCGTALRGAGRGHAATLA